MRQSLLVDGSNGELLAAAAAGDQAAWDAPVERHTSLLCIHLMRRTDRNAEAFAELPDLPG
jgi:hypothetical protein